ncbi:MAG: ATP-dependent RNA helicase DeaD [Planctomycetota bacterium]|nr:MAG: ATP-dependent RNA helicase DeaD [Planctomycetota bacterium]
MDPVSSEFAEPEVPASPGFRELGLSDALLTALDAVGYEAPSPIQARTIPLLLAGRDVLGQAQTGTGKTAAFALPLIDRLDLKRRESRRAQVLVLAPTRELAIQVAEAFQKYAAHLPGFHVLPIYGGQPYEMQQRPLKRGVHVVVGTPGRVMDHMRRGTLDVSELSTLVLDEADEMLAMGFLEDVTWVLEQTPHDRQIALFSATMPTAIKRIVKQHLNDPEHVAIEVSAKTATTIRQRKLVLHYGQKLDAMTRLLEVESTEGMLVFVRTKTATVELAEKLEARGYATAVLNGDIPQRQRERTVEKFKRGDLDLLVATDVAARGLDVDRITHVLNFDIPHDAEAYIHRIGRTGRAGRSGEAIVFVTPRERRQLADIERTIGQRIEEMTVPSTDEVNRRRIARFKQRITDTRNDQDLKFFETLLAEYVDEAECTELEAAAALAHLVQGREPLILAETQRKRPMPKFSDTAPSKHAGDRGKGPKQRRAPDEGMTCYRIEVGHKHGVLPGQIVGAIAGESGLEGSQIGRIDIRFDYTLVDLPEGMPPEIQRILSRTRICRQPLKISKATQRGTTPKSTASKSGTGKFAAGKASSAKFVGGKGKASGAKFGGGASGGQRGSAGGGKFSSSKFSKGRGAKGAPSPSPDASDSE